LRQFFIATMKLVYMLTWTSMTTSY